MKKIFVLFTMLLITTVTWAEGGDGFYKNPIIDRSLPDPTVIRAKDGFYYLYATENIPNTPIYRSKNLVDWHFVGTAFTDATRPQWNPRGKLWAPDINYIKGKYVLYYAKSTWGGEWECGIGVATADKPEGPFTDHGAMFISKDIGVQNSIDAFFIEDKGHNYLVWGSFRGIYAIELTDDGLSIKPGAEKKQIAGTFMEGTYIHRHGGFYYLIGSAGSCCDGERSTYHVTCARSKDLFGPYVDKTGRSAMENHYETIIHRSDDVIGPGHNSEIISDDKGQDWILYHGFKASDPGAGRVVFMDRVEWVDGWPYVAGCQPSTVSERPNIKSLLLADPTIFADDGRFYLYGTSPNSAVGRFEVFASDDLYTWEGPVGKLEGYSLSPDCYGTKGFWAPQVFKHNGKYKIIYTANEQIAIAEGDSPLGPFTQDKAEMIPAPCKTIDPFIFFDKGKAYLFHVRLINGNRIYVAEMNKDLKSIKEKTAREVIAVEDGWEDTAKAKWGVAEGPTCIKVGKTYYLFYSCNDFRNIDYAVGYATASSPLGPWKKHGKPIITRKLMGHNGTGHGDVFKDKDGNWMYVFHTHNSRNQVGPRRTAVVKLNFDGKDFTADESTFRFLER